MFSLEKLFFMWYKYNEKYIATGQISKLPNSFTPQDYLEYVIKNNGTPFVIFRNNDMNQEELLRIVSDDNILSLVLDKPKKELEKLSYEQRCLLLKNHLHRAIYGFMIFANSKKELYENYKSLKSDLKSNQISIWNMPINNDSIMEQLDKCKILDAESSSTGLDPSGFMFINVPKYVTEIMKEMITNTYA